MQRILGSNHEDSRVVCRRCGQRCNLDIVENRLSPAIITEPSAPIKATGKRLASPPPVTNDITFHDSKLLLTTNCISAVHASNAGGVKTLSVVPSTL